MKKNIINALLCFLLSSSVNALTIHKDRTPTSESSLETTLTDVSDVFTNNDGALTDDDLSDNNSTELLDTASIVYETEIDTFAELDAKVADKALTNNTDAQTLTNKTIDADSNTVTNIGSSEIKSELITGQTAVTVDNADYVLVSDASDAGNLKKVLASDLSSGGGGGGDVYGPSSSTDNAIARFDTTTGKLLQNTSGATISDTFTLTVSGELIEGAGSTTPTGGFGLLLSTNTASFTADGLSTVYVCDATSGNITVTLPASIGVSSRIYYILKKDSTANTITVDGNGSETIAGDLTFDLLNEGESIGIISDGSNWYIL